MRFTASFALSLLCVMTTGIVQAQQPAIAPVAIAEVSGLLTLAPGLRILDAYRVPSKEGTQMFIDSETGKEITGGSLIAVGPLVVGARSILVSGMYSTETNPVFTVFVYQVEKGVKTVARAVYNKGPLPEPEIMEMRHIGLTEGTLLLWLRYNVGNPPYPEMRYIVARITGDWKALGFDIPDGRLSADLNQDGKVDAKDLVLFQRQWKP